MIFGIGINDADYVVYPKINNKQIYCLFYLTWKNMLQRCYCEKYQTLKPSYKNCIVCNEWFTFSNFKTWMETQDWKGKQLDKDIFGDGKLYSPETCCFIPQWLNKTIISGNGITYRLKNKKFQVRVNVGGKSQHLGYFDTPEEAHQAYIKAKKEYVTRKMKDYPDERIHQAVLEKIK